MIQVQRASHIDEESATIEIWVDNELFAEVVENQNPRMIVIHPNRLNQAWRLDLDEIVRAFGDVANRLHE